MDILTHILSGVATGTILVSYSNKGIREKIAIVTMGAIGGFFPDIDAISLWSKFDAYIGHVFGLNHSGQTIYFSKFWYSHHAFLHSLFAALLLAVVIISIIYLFNHKTNYTTFAKAHILLPISFILGYAMHLLGDLPTPSAVWGGVNLFWPSQSYIGGYGNVWWWNNYDVFLIIVACIAANNLVYITGFFVQINKRLVTTCIGIFFFLFILFQINHRQVDFNYTGNTNKFQIYEQQSKEEQKRILGKKIFSLMEKLDNAIPFNF